MPNKKSHPERRESVTCPKCKTEMVSTNRYGLDNKDTYVWYICPRRKETGESGCGHRIIIKVKEFSERENAIEYARRETNSAAQGKIEESFKKTHDKLHSQIAQCNTEMLDISKKLNQEILERREIERQNHVKDALSELLSKVFSREEFLNGAVKIIYNFTQCRCAGIRVLNKKGEMPYEAYTGFSREFLKPENLLSINRDQCICIRVITGIRELLDIPFMTPGGSFCCDHITNFISEIPEEDKNNFGGICAENGFSSIAVIPIHYGNNIVGIIHLADEKTGKVSLEVIKFIEAITPVIGGEIYKFNMVNSLDQREKELNETNELLDKILSDPHSSVAYIDTNLNFIFVNQGYARADGRTPEVFIGHNYFDLYSDEEMRPIFNNIIETGKVYYIHAKSFGDAQSAEGTKNFWDWNIYPVKDISGMTKGIALYLVNISEPKDTKKELTVEPRHLFDIGTFVATAAHELRNPLGVIRAAAYNIKKKKQNLSLHKHVANIEKKLSESEYIINNLLTYSKIKIPAYEKVQIYNILEECIISAQKKFHERRIVIDKKIKSIENIVIDADPFQLIEIFNNILNNAYESIINKKGRIEICAKLDKPRGVITISVKDNGTGIDKEDFKKLFSPFFTKKLKGTGLGLLICKELVNLHGGKIDIESEKDKGTMVAVALPIRKMTP